MLDTDNESGVGTTQLVFDTAEVSTASVLKINDGKFFNCVWLKM